MSITALAAGSALKSVFDRLAKLADEQGLSLIKKRFQASSIQSKICKKIASLDRVRTVFKKQAKISEFYVAPRFNSTSKNLSLSSLQDIDGSLLITGIGGHGKSILLRYIAIREAEEGNYIPIFSELKRLGEASVGETVWQFLMRTLEQFDIPSDPGVLNFLLASGHALVLLDAFDEVSADERSRVAREIEDLIVKFPNAKFIVSTRPDYEITHSPHLEQLSFADLTIDQINLIIRRIYGQSNISDFRALQRALSENENIIGVLKTPLIVSLLTVTFNKNMFLPETLPRFYEQLFDAMLVQHDSAKMLTRLRKSKLADSQFRQMFEASCAISLQKNNLRFGKSTFLKNMATALSDQGLAAELSEVALSDTVNITCLVVKDGEEYEFIHKTILEYFAASFIAHLPEARAQTFYDAVINKYVGNGWIQAKTFLEELDRYRFTKYFLLPMLEQYLLPIEALNCVESESLTFDELMPFYGNFYLILHTEKNPETGDREVRGYGISTEKGPAINSLARHSIIGTPVTDSFFGIANLKIALDYFSDLWRNHLVQPDGVVKILFKDVLRSSKLNLEETYLINFSNAIIVLRRRRVAALSVLGTQETSGGFLF